MLFWTLAALLTAATVVALMRPLSRRSDQTAPQRAEAVAVYRDQLLEVEADRARGLLTAAEADAARLEISRRLLSADRASSERGAETMLKSGSARQAVAWVALLALPIGAMGLYLFLGSPGLPGRPYVARSAVDLEQAGIENLVQRVEKHLIANPSDGRGWDVVAPVYLKLGRNSDAIRAYSRAIGILGESPKRLSGLAEASVIEANGIVTPVAKQAYARLASLDPKRLDARFWLTLALEQDGKLSEAVTGYRALLSNLPDDVAWRRTVEERIAGIQKRLGRESETGKEQPSTPRLRGPTEADVNAARQMSESDRAAMIEGMVGSLAARLEQSPNDVDGWLRLIRSQVVLGRREEASASLTKARGHLAGNGEALVRLESLARELGLKAS